MNRFLPLGLIALFSTFFTLSSVAQINVASTSGYMVHISITPVAIVPTSGSCVNGYNYNIRLNYSISFTGTNIPSSGLYTLQGTLGCGTNTHFFDLPNNGGSGTVTSGSNVWTTKKDCSTATLSSSGCNQLVIEINGDGISNRFVTAPLNITLPIKLVSFNAAFSQNIVKLNWTTASEENNDYFTIERSANASEWTSIKTVKGAGNSSSLMNYEISDLSPLTGISYYRLRQTDIDGHSTYSEVVSVETASNNAKISLFPVPNSGNTLNLRGITNYSENELSVLSTSGAILHRVTLTKSSVELPSLKTGVYIILIKNKVSGEATSLRYVKI